MEAVKAFNEELSGIYETKPPISRAKMTQLTKKAIKGIKFYKHIVQSMEKFVQKCRPEYKVPGLYVIDSVVRQSRHQFGPEKDVFMPRLCKNILTTFQHIYKCPLEDKPRILRVLNLWQKNTVFPQDIVQQLTVMAGAPTPEVQGSTSAASDNTAQKPTQPDPANLTNLLANLLANPDTSQIQNLAGLLSSSQQNQLEDLLKQVKGNDQQHDVVPPPPSHPNNSNQTNVFHPPQKNVQPPFLHSKAAEVERQQPAFNREVLDFDYSDEEQTPPSKAAKHSHGIDPSLLAKLPTADQIQQLTAPLHGGMPLKRDADIERLKVLEQEQEIFNKQIQQMSNDMNDRGGSLQRNDRSDHRRKRSRSRSNHRHHRRRSHSRDRHRSRRSRSRDRSRRSRRSRSRSVERRRDKNGFPPIRDACVSVCTTTLWIGNISAKVMQHELQAMVEEYGEVESINMIPPRGCAYVCMKKRVEADKALQKIRHSRLGGKSLKCDWAPSKEMPEGQKSTWVKEHGANYVPLIADPGQLRSLSSWGCIDPESVPEHRRDELNRQVAVSSSVPICEVAEQPKPPQMVQAFNPTPGIMPNVAMVARPQMSMMVRPFQLNPFGMSQRMGFQQQPIPQQDPKPDIKMDMGSTTPTADEHTDEAPPPPQSLPQFQSPYGTVSVAQRFPGAMPVQLRMMPNMGQQIMPQRMGVMPIRMGIPMQLRPGFHPGMQPRISMQGGPQMLQNQMHPSMQQLQPPRMRPQQPMNRFPGGIRMAMPGQMQMRLPGLQPSEVFRPAGPPAQMPERRSSNSSVNGLPDHIRPESQPPSDINRPPQFDLPREFEGGSNSVEQPPTDAGRLSQDIDKPPPRREMDRPPQGVDMLPRDMDRPPRDMDRPPRDMDRPPRDMDRPPRDMDRPPRDMDRPPRDMDRPPRDMDRPPRDGNRGDSRDRRDYDRGRRERSRDRDRRDRDRDMDRDRRGPRDFGRGRRDHDRGGRDFDRRGRGPPAFRGRSFRGHDDRGDRGWGRGGDRGGFRGRGRGGSAGHDERRRSPEIDSEEEEYQRKRKETLRKRHEQEEEYAVEKIDLSAFGLPSGFGGVLNTADSETQDKDKDNSTDKNDKSPKSSSSRLEKDDAAQSRKAWLDEQTKKHETDTQSSDNPPTETDEHSSEVKDDILQSTGEADSLMDETSEPAVEPSSDAPDLLQVTTDDATDRSPGTPTVDEQASQIIEEEVYFQDSSGPEQSNLESQESKPTDEVKDSLDEEQCEVMDES